MAYLAKRFHGSQRQPGLPTIEGELIDGMVEAGVITDPHRARF
jgi:tRNA U38,U39,U40 pseudouridine synthase TruA